MKNKFHVLEVKSVSRESSDIVEIGFKIPVSLIDQFRFSPGQYLTLKVPVDGKILRRAYSICSAVNESSIRVLVKRLAGGRVSNELNDNIKPGDKLEVLAPGGGFKITMNDEDSGTYFLLGAGSGITPLVSMAVSLLKGGSKSKCHLIYGNRDEQNTIFKSKIDCLQLVFPDRFSVEYVLSKPNEYKGANWTGKTGRLNQEHISSFLSEKKADNVKGYYICGPGEMIEATVQALANIGIDEALVHREYFTSTDLKSSDEEAILPEGVLIRKTTITLNGETKEFSIPESTNIVQGMVNGGVEPPYSCLSGSCSTCKAKLTQGEVKMDVNIGLEEGEEDAGYILTCQCHPLTDDVALTFDIN